MKKKLPYIIFAAALIVAAAIVIKGIKDKKDTENRYIEYAKNVDAAVTTETSEDSQIYEYIQTNPENGLAVIYTFKVFGEKDGVQSGLITIDGHGIYMNISCAVTEEADSTVFIFSKILEDSKNSIDANQGDILVKLHKKDGRVIPEWIKLQPVIEGEQVISNF